jgi:hypothetical protein
LPGAKWTRRGNTTKRGKDIVKEGPSEGDNLRTILFAHHVGVSTISPIFTNLSRQTICHYASSQFLSTSLIASIFPCGADLLDEQRVLLDEQSISTILKPPAINFIFHLPTTQPSSPLPASFHFFITHPSTKACSP